MKYLIAIILLIISIYPLSYAVYNWKNKNKLGAIGVVIIAAGSVAAPTLFLFLR